MNILAQIDALLKQMQKSPAQVAKEMDYPSGTEPGMKHPSGGFFILRDDGAVEMGCAGANVMAAPGHVTLRGKTGMIATNDLHVHTSPVGLWFGYQRFNPAWFSPPLDFTYPWRTSPLVLNSPASLSATFLTGAPMPGQVPMPFSSVFHPVPLFGPNQMLQVMAKSIAQLTRALTLGA